MAKKTEIKPTKTYASEANVDKAVDKLFSNCPCRYFVMSNEEGRFYPVFIGIGCLDYGVQFHFNVIA